MNFPDKSLARRNVVLDRMKDLGLVTDAGWKAARAIPLSAMLHVCAGQELVVLDFLFL